MTDNAPLSTASSAGSSGAGAGATSPLPLVAEPFFTPPPPHLLHMLMSSDKCQVRELMWSAKQLQLQGDPTMLRPPPSAFGAPLAPTWELLQVKQYFSSLYSYNRYELLRQRMDATAPA
ncbi:putative Orphan nuclear receptor NR6A1 [Operophtera brumata]|uniref:Putative Orphan nuclear receptor NR6A1 n=1 Tax=Operophtera brumata TaxID=104452 RepID=A0A0L7K3R8_OPEBR|nr:putative Orphan nuclear receptor NR6A1 [Operophtera brumata]